MTLKFHQWVQINEANFFSRIGDWLSQTFGPSYNKLKEFLEEYKDLETKYIDEWEEIQIELDKLELQDQQVISDPAEKKKIQRYILRNRELMQNIQRLHEKNVDFLMRKVRKTIGEEAKLRAFWELNKSKTDAEIAEIMYQKSKQLSRDEMSKGLYRKYKDAVLLAKDKDEEFRKSFPDYDRERTFLPPIQQSLPISVAPGMMSSPTYVSSLERIEKMTLSEFMSYAQGLGSKDAKKLGSDLVKLRNDLSLQQDYERDAINSEIAKGKVGKDEAAKMMKSIREKYMDRIRSLRSKITVARRYA